MKRSIFSCVALAWTLATAGCASDAVLEPVGERSVRYGTIEEIVPVELEGDHQLGLGAVIGGVAGGVLGHQVGSGRGRDAATLIGAIGGAFVGHEVQSRYVETRPGQRITVVLDGSGRVSITQPAGRNLAVGDRVRIDGAGEQARVTRD